MRLRRYISRDKDSRKREGNLILTNSVLKEMKLKSLVKIKKKKVKFFIEHRMTEGEEGGKKKRANPLFLRNN